MFSFADLIVDWESNQYDSNNKKVTMAENEHDKALKKNINPIITETIAVPREVEQVTQAESEELGETPSSTQKPHKPKPPKKPLRASTVKPVQQAVTVPVTAITPTTANPNRRYPCTCGHGLCSCCTGIVLENFNLPLPFRPKACANVTYEPDDFAFNFKLLFNNRLLYKTRMSGIVFTLMFHIKILTRLMNLISSYRHQITIII